MLHIHYEESICTTHNKILGKSAYQRLYSGGPHLSLGRLVLFFNLMKVLATCCKVTRPYWGLTKFFKTGFLHPTLQVHPTPSSISLLSPVTLALMFPTLIQYFAYAQEHVLGHTDPSLEPVFVVDRGKVVRVEALTTLYWTTINSNHLWIILEDFGFDWSPQKTWQLGWWTCHCCWQKLVGGERIEMNWWACYNEKEMILEAERWWQMTSPPPPSNIGCVQSTVVKSC